MAPKIMTRIMQKNTRHSKRKPTDLSAGSTCCHYHHPHRLPLPVWLIVPWCMKSKQESYWRCILKVIPSTASAHERQHLLASFPFPSRRQPQREDGTNRIWRGLSFLDGVTDACFDAVSCSRISLCLFIRWLGMPKCFPRSPIRWTRVHQHLWQATRSSLSPATTDIVEIPWALARALHSYTRFYSLIWIKSSEGNVLFWQERFQYVPCKNARHTHWNSSGPNASSGTRLPAWIIARHSPRTSSGNQETRSSSQGSFLRSFSWYSIPSG